MTAFSQSSGLVDSASGAEVVVDGVDAAADCIELVKLEDMLVARFTEVVGAATDKVVIWPLMVVATNATEGIELVLVVSSRGARTAARAVDVHKAKPTKNWMPKTMIREVMTDLRSRCWSFNGNKTHAKSKRGGWEMKETRSEH